LQIPNINLRYPEDSPLETIDQGSFMKMIELKQHKLMLEAEQSMMQNLSQEMAALMKYLEGEAQSAKDVYDKEVRELEGLTILNDST
jgi:hypothetical protein